MQLPPNTMPDKIPNYTESLGFDMLLYRMRNIGQSPSRDSCFYRHIQRTLGSMQQSFCLRFNPSYRHGNCRVSIEATEYYTEIDA